MKHNCKNSLKSGGGANYRIIARAAAFGAVLWCGGARAEVASSGRTLQWQGGVTRVIDNENVQPWSALGNWKDVDGNTNAVPMNGDVLRITTNPGGNCRNDIPGLAPKQLRLTNYQVQSPAGEPLVFSADGSLGIFNEGYLHYDLPTAFTGTNVTLYSSSTMVIRGKFKSADGEPCGVVKTGGGLAGINGFYCSSAADYAGFRYVRIENGTWAYGINGNNKGSAYLQEPQTVTFAAAGTKLVFGQEWVLRDLKLIEEGTAVNGAHEITSQWDNDNQADKDGCLTIAGTPPDNPTVFTGTFTKRADFKWSPESSDHVFELAGGTSTTTGNVEVLNGTLRLKNGAGFSRLGTLTLKNGAGTVFEIAAPCAEPFNAKKIVLDTGAEKLKLAAGVTVNAETMTVGTARLAPGTYTAADNAWIAGAGCVTVARYAPTTLRWTDTPDSNTNFNWSNPLNWISDLSDENDVPRDGDILHLPENGHRAAANSFNDLVDLRPRRIYVPSAYTYPKGNAVIFDGADTTDGIYNSGFMYYGLPTVVNTDAITLWMNGGGNAGYKAGFYSTDGHAFRLIKTGNGTAAFMNAATEKYTGLSRIDIKGGTFAFGWQNEGSATPYPSGLEVVFDGESTALKIGTNMTLKDLVLRETSAAAGKAHWLQQHDNPDKTLTVTGTPAVRRQVFTGNLSGTLSFTWAVDSRDLEFVFSGASSQNTTTRTLTVAGGTVRLEKGATFTQLGALALTGGAAACFAVDDPPAAPFRAGTLTLATGDERLNLAAGAVIRADAATVDGVALADGVYTGSNIFGTRAAWITGGGFLCVGAETPDPLAAYAAPGEPATAGVWTANGGADTAVDTPANWGAADNTALPDLATGALDATFAAGTGARLTRDVWLRSLALACVHPFTFTADGGFVAALGAGGLTTAGTGAAYAFAWPLLLTADQAWTVGEGDTVTVTGGLFAHGPQALRVTGGGTLNLDAPGCLTGAQAYSNLTLNVNADNAFGEGDGAVDIDFKTVKTTFSGVTVDRTVRDSRHDTGASTVGQLCFAAGTTTFNRDLDLGCAPMWPTFARGSVVRVKGSLRRDTTSWLYLSGATLQLDGPVAVDGGSALDLKDNTAITLNAPSNNIGVVWLWIDGNNIRLRTTVPDAFAAPQNVRIRKTETGVTGFEWDLCGCDQTLDLWGIKGTGTTVTSETAAFLHLLHNRPCYQNSATLMYESTNLTHFAGGAGVSFDGTSFFQLNATSSSTGTVQVTRGRLEMGLDGHWPNASRAVVKGGTLRLSNSQAFGSDVTFDLSSAGKLSLDAGVRARCAGLVIDGEEVRADGTYGSGESAARHKNDDVFAGPGVLVLYRDNGTLLIFR